MGQSARRRLENHAAAVALHYMLYNFGRIHKTLRVASAMQAGLSLSEIVGLLDAEESRAAA